MVTEDLDKHMIPIPFPEANKELLPPSGQEDRCGSLVVYTDGDVCLSCWKPSWKEWLKLVFCGNVWVYVRSGRTQPPISITANDPFQEK